MAMDKYADAAVKQTSVGPKQWQEVKQASIVGQQEGFGKTASPEFNDYDPDEYLLTHCFPAGHQVLMADGTEKPIEEIQLGDRVITHEGRSKAVTETMSREVDETLVEITPSGSGVGSIFCTKEHPVLILSSEKSGCTSGYPSYEDYKKCIFGGKKICKEHNCSSNEYELEWVPASEVKPGDRVVTPYLTEQRSGISDQRMRLLGYYVAEGRVDVNPDGQDMVRFTFHEDEISRLGEEVTALMKDCFGVYSHSKIKNHKRGDKAVTLSFSDDTAAAWFHEHAGVGSREKSLSEAVLYSSHSSQYQFMGAWANGDGAYNPHNGIRLTTASEDLASQGSLILQRLGIHCNPLRSDNRGYERPTSEYDYIPPFNGWKITVPQTESHKLDEYVRWDISESDKSKSTKKRYRGEDGILSEVQAVSQRAFEGVVYNFSVEDDESYIVNRQAVHNCTIIASVDTDEADVKTGEVKQAGMDIYRPHNDFLIKPETSQYVNQNGDAWERELLLATYNTFVGSENYVEHIQIPELSKGKVVDACARDLDDTIYVDILVATNKKHEDLIQKIVTGEIDTLSMGCTISYSVCSRCGNVAHEETDLCEHALNQKGQTFIDSEGNERIIAELCGHKSDPDSVEFIEASWVGNAAFDGAVCQTIMNPDVDVDETKSMPNNHSSLQDMIATEFSESIADQSIEVDGFFNSVAASVNGEPSPEDRRRKIAQGFGGGGDDDEDDGGDDKGVFDQLKEEVKEQLGEQIQKDIDEEFREKDDSGQHPPEENDEQEGDVDAPNESVIQSRFAKQVTQGLSKQTRQTIWEELGKLSGVNTDNPLYDEHTLFAYYLKDAEELGKCRADTIHECVTKVGSLDRFDSPESYLASCTFVLGRLPSGQESQRIIRRARCLT